MRGHTFFFVAAHVMAVLWSVTVLGQTEWYVDVETCPDLGSGTAEDPFCYIQDAICFADDADSISVAPGVYHEVIDLMGRAVTLRSTDGPGVTTIDGTDMHDTVVQCVSGEGADTVLDGFTVTGGNNYYGGGMVIHQSGPDVVNCVFRENHAGSGAGVYNHYGQATITKCVFIGNTASGAGGGICDYFSNTVTRNCLFIQNTVTGDGGGASNVDGDSSFIDCLFAGNDARYHGGGMSNLRSSPTVVNCTFVQNSAEFGGGMYHTHTSSTTTKSCVFWGNTGGTFGGTGTPVISFSHVDMDPLFVDPDGPDDDPDTFDDNDYSLSTASPCVNKGDPGRVIEPGETDLAGAVRLQGCRVDIGAYESGEGQMWGDFDHSAGIDLADFAAFQVCFGDAAGMPDWFNTCMCLFDDTTSDVIDLDDYVRFASAFRE